MLLKAINLCNEYFKNFFTNNNKDFSIIPPSEIIKNTISPENLTNSYHLSQETFENLILLKQRQENIADFIFIYNKNSNNPVTSKLNKTNNSNLISNKLSM